MNIFLPVAGISMNLFVLVGAGGLVGFLSGLVGVGGGFLLTPVLIMLGIPPTVAAASDSCQIVAASSSGVAAHFRLGNVDYKLGSILLTGGLVDVDILKGAITAPGAHRPPAPGLPDTCQPEPPASQRACSREQVVLKDIATLQEQS